MALTWCVNRVPGARSVEAKVDAAGQGIFLLCAMMRDTLREGGAPDARSARSHADALDAFVRGSAYAVAPPADARGGDGSAATYALVAGDAALPQQWQQQQPSATLAAVVR